MGKKKSIGGIVPLTPTERELEGWNFLFDDYLFMDPIKDKGQEPGRMCYCTHCRKAYRVNEWARVISYEEREIITAKQKNRVKCAKCGTVCEARFVNVSRRKTQQSKYVAVIRANGHDEVLVDGYLLWKDYGEAKDGYTLQFTALPQWRKCERYVLRPGEATKYERSYGYSRSNNDEDANNWRVDSWGDGIYDMFLSYKGCMAQRYEPFHLFGEHELSRTFLRYNALREWKREAHDQKNIRYLSLLCLYPGLETLMKAGYGDIVKKVVFDKLKFYGRIDLMKGDPQSILGLSRAECTMLREHRHDMSTILKAHKHHCKNKEWSVGDICALQDADEYGHSLTDQLCFCNGQGTSPRVLLGYLMRQHERRLRQYDEAIHTNACLARHGGGVAPRLHDEWIHLRDWHDMYVKEMGVPPRELYPRDVSEAHDAILNMRNERIERQIAAYREQRGVTQEQEMQWERENWQKKTQLKYENADEIDGNVEKCECMDKRLRWRIKHLSFAKGRYMTVIPQRTRELVVEGEALHHCVGTYLERYASGKTNIVFLRDREHLEQPLLTVEVNDDGYVEQCYGFNDDQVYGKDEEWMKPELDKYLEVYDKEIRAFADAYREHLRNHFEAMKNKKERTTA